MPEKLEHPPHIAFNARFISEWEQQTGTQYTLEVDFLTLWLVIGELQNCLRVPRKWDGTTATVQAFVEQVRSQIAPDGTALAEMLTMGDECISDRTETP